MNKFILILCMALLLMNISVSYADCGENQKLCGKVCIATDAVCYTCGADCHAYYTGEGANKTLNITGTGVMNNYRTTRDGGRWYSEDTPWKDDTFKKVVIESGISKIGNSAFTGFGITSVSIPDTVTSIGEDVFLNNKLTSVNIPDAVTFIGQAAFHSNRLTSVVLPDSLTSINNYGFYNNPLFSVTIPDSLTSAFSIIFGNDSGLLDNINIICKGTEQSCAYIKNYMSDYAGNNYADKVHIASNYKECDSKMYYWNGAECLREPDVTKRKCCSSCKDMGGYCNRIRYTPAEAAEVLKDDNTNEVTITFRK